MSFWFGPGPSQVHTPDMPMQAADAAHDIGQQALTDDAAVAALPAALTRHRPDVTPEAACHWPCTATPMTQIVTTWCRHWPSAIC